MRARWDDGNYGQVGFGSVIGLATIYTRIIQMPSRVIVMMTKLGPDNCTTVIILTSINTMRKLDSASDILENWDCWLWGRDYEGLLWSGPVTSQYLQ